MSGSGTSTPGAGPSSQTLMDPYRSLASAMQRPLAPFLPVGSTPEVAQILGLSSKTYADRVEGKTLLLDDKVVPKTSSAVLTGRKLHQGDSAARASARESLVAAKRKREGLGLVTMRQARKRAGTVNRGGHIDYTSLIPLNHLHTLYLISILSLHPLPHPLPSPLPPLPHGCSPDGIAGKLVKADFTGIILSVISARNTSLVGIQGIVIEETGATFRLVPKDGTIRVVPKEGTQFGISFPAYAPASASSAQNSTGGSTTPTGTYRPESVASAPLVADGGGELQEQVDIAQHLRICPRIEITLLGTNFGYRSGDRAGRRFKLAQGQAGNGWGEDWVRGEWDGVWGQTGAAIVSVSTGERKAGQVNTDTASERPAGANTEEQAGKAINATGKVSRLDVDVEAREAQGAVKANKVENGQKQTKSKPVALERGMGQGGMRKKGKSRRKDPLAGGSRDAVFR